MDCSNRGLRGLLLILAFWASCGLLIAQSQSTTQQNIPDAPSAQRPQSFPLPNPTVPSRPLPSQTPPDNPQPQEPPPQVKTVPPGGETKEPESGRDKLYTFIKPVNFVVVPVSVKTPDNHLVYGLVQQNFSVYENGARQAITFFTSDPFPISAAVVVDVGMAEVALKRVEETLGALGGAFGEFDEVAYYTYSNTVSKQQDFVPATSERANLTLRKLKEKEGRAGGVPVVGGPMASGPTVNGRPADPGNLNTTAGPTSNTRLLEPSRVLNDAILRAAVDLSKRDRTRRKIIFVISEGREDRSNASYADVLQYLNTYGISVYGVAVDSAAIPGYSKLNKIHLPRQGYGNILPKYANATGGEILDAFTQDAIEQAYARITEQARNQYTLGYTTTTAPSSGYREIEVRVNKPDLKVYARDGYYPLPPARK